MRQLSKLGFGERLKYEHGRGGTELWPPLRVACSVADGWLAARGKLFPVDALSDFRQTLVMNLFVRGFCFENQVRDSVYSATVNVATYHHRDLLHIGPSGRTDIAPIDDIVSV